MFDVVWDYYSLKQKGKQYKQSTSFNMTRRGWRYWGGLQKFLDTQKGGSEKIRGRGLRKFVYFKTNRREGRGS